MTEGDDAVRLEAFLTQRKRLLRLAYRHLGSTAEAEDIVQEAWLRFSKIEDVGDPPKLLSRIVTRLCIDRASSAQQRREVYVGPWLPEPATGEPWQDDSDRALDISFAVMRTLEQLSPAERAAFFLHDLWELDYDEVAATLSRTPQACRKLVSRAREQLAAAKPRFHPDRGEIERLSAAFQQAVAAADPALLKAALAEDVELVSDGGGKVKAARNILRGADAVSRFLIGLATKELGTIVMTTELVTINDHPAFVVRLDGSVDHVFAIDTDGDGRIAAIYIVRNPDKLAGLAA